MPNPAAAGQTDFWTLQDWSNLGQAFGLLSAFASVIALVGLKAAFDSIKSQALIQREAIARQQYSNYLKLAFDNPQFSSGFGYSKGVNYEKYEWYVAQMLDACEAILLYFPEKEANLWLPTIKMQIDYHCEYYFDKRNMFSTYYKRVYSKKIIELIDIHRSDYDKKEEGGWRGQA